MTEATTEASSFEAAPNIALYFERSGRSDAATTLVFLHGFGASTLNWSDVRHEFDSSYRTYYLDLKGHGRSSRPRDGDYSLDTQAEILLRFLRDQVGADPVIIGHSYGGAVALLAGVKAIKAGSRRPYSKMVLVDVPAYPQKIPPFLAVLLNPVLRGLAAMMPARLSSRLSLGQAFWDNKKVTPQIVERYASVLEPDNSYYALGLAAEQLLPQDLSGYLQGLSSIDVPTLIIWGDHDPIVPINTAFRLSHDLKLSSVDVINNCGHVPQEECPLDFIATVFKFLNPDES